MKLSAAAPSASIEHASSPVGARDVPSLDDGSAAAAASLDQVASYVSLLTSALQTSPDEYARTIKRGFLESAINYTKYAYGIVDYDRTLDNDGFKGMIEGAILDSLIAARQLGIPVAMEPNILDELRMAGSAATNAAKALNGLVQRPGSNQ